MKKNNLKRINLKNNLGFTMTDLVVAIIIIMMFTGVIGSLLYSTLKTNLQTKVLGNSTNYAIQILEDIDKTPYEEVVNGMEQSYINKFSIPSGFNINIEVSNYNEDNEKEDLIKIVQLTITTEFSENTERLVIKKLKVKEL